MRGVALILGPETGAWWLISEQAGAEGHVLYRGLPDPQFYLLWGVVPRVDAPDGVRVQVDHSPGFLNVRFANLHRHVSAPWMMFSAALKGHLVVSYTCT